MSDIFISGSVVRPPSGQEGAVGRPTAGRVSQLESGRAQGGSTRSGYARDIMPERVEPDEAAGRACPIGTEHGGQEGKLPPHLRKRGNYGACSASEAETLKSRRLRGDLPRIDGGIDTPGVPKSADARMEEGFDRPDMPVRPAGGPGMAAPVQQMPPQQQPAWSGPGPLPAPFGAEQMMQRFMGQMLQMMQTLQARPQPAPEPERIQADPQTHSALGQVSGMVSFGTPGGTYTVPAISVVSNGMAVLVVLPLDGKHATFEPQPGARLALGCGKDRWNCLYPGACFTLPEARAVIMVLLIDDRGTPEPGEGAA